MTLEERAQRLINLWLNDESPDFKIATNILKELKAAIEEDRKSRECCKQEREACAKLGDEEAGCHAGEMERLRRNDLAVVIEEKAMKTAKKITRKIRARSESENNQQKGD